jgi:hypothetical protein
MSKGLYRPAVSQPQPEQQHVVRSFVVSSKAELALVFNNYVGKQRFNVLALSLHEMYVHSSLTFSDNIETDFPHGPERMLRRLRSECRFTRATLDITLCRRTMIKTFSVINITCRSLKPSVIVEYVSVIYINNRFLTLLKSKAGVTVIDKGIPFLSWLESHWKTSLSGAILDYFKK